MYMHAPPYKFKRKFTLIQRIKGKFSFTVIHNYCCVLCILFWHIDNYYLVDVTIVSIQSFSCCQSYHSLKHTSHSLFRFVTFWDLNLVWKERWSQDWVKLSVEFVKLITKFCAQKVICQHSMNAWTDILPLLAQVRHKTS